MRVMHIVQSLQVGGLERLVQRLVLAHRAKGIESVVLAYDSDGPVGDALRAEGISVVVLPGGEGLRPELVHSIAKEIRRHRITHVHTHHLGPLIYGGTAARVCGAKHVHTEHSLELFDAPRRRLAARIAGTGATLVAVGNSVAEGMRGAYGRDATVVQNGVEVPEHAAPRPVLDAGRPLVAFIAARLSREKGVDLALRALALDTKHRWNLVIAGDGPERANLESLRDALGLGERVRFLGALPDIRPELRRADALMLPSRREGLPLVLLEAMVEELPILATDVGGVCQLLGGDGVVVPPESPVSLYRGLAILEDRIRTGRAVPAARRLRDHARAHHSLDAMASQYLSLYRGEHAETQRRAA